MCAGQGLNLAPGAAYPVLHALPVYIRAHACAGGCYQGGGASLEAYNNIPYHERCSACACIPKTVILVIAILKPHDDLQCVICDPFMFLLKIQCFQIGPELILFVQRDSNRATVVIQLLLFGLEFS